MSTLGYMLHVVLVYMLVRNLLVYTARMRKLGLVPPGHPSFMKNLNELNRYSYLEMLLSWHRVSWFYSRPGMIVEKVEKGTVEV